VRRALAATALIEEHDPVLRRVEEAALLTVGAAPRTAVQEDDRLALGVPAFFEVQAVDG
jgi:hypothetical protein